jgi:hypothetical protein
MAATFPLPVPPSFFRALLLLTFLLTLAKSGHAQMELRISGSVSDKDTRQAIPGATVWNVSQKRGTVADAEGDFNVSVGATDTLEFRAVGYKTQQLITGGSGLAQIIVQVQLKQTSIVLGEVIVREGRPDDAVINRALRNMKRPTPPANAVKLPPKPKPLFPVDSTAPKPPTPTLENPMSLLYATFSREGKQQQKMAEINKAKQVEAQRQVRRTYNAYFLDNRGYEVEGDAPAVPVKATSNKSVQPVPTQPSAGSSQPHSY